MSKCSFLGSIAPLQSAIQIHADGGMRIKIDIPQNQEGAALELLTLRGKTLRVTLELDEGNGSERNTAIGRRSTKQRVK